MIFCDAISNFLKYCSFSCFGRSDNQASLTLAQRSDDIDQAGRYVFRSGYFQSESLVGINRREIVKVGPTIGLVRVPHVDSDDFEQGEIPFAVFGRPYLSDDKISRPQAKSSYLRRGE